jgi:hypothetical protein
MAWFSKIKRRPVHSYRRLKPDQYTRLSYIRGTSPRDYGESAGNEDSQEIVSAENHPAVSLACRGARNRFPRCELREKAASELNRREKLM